MNTVLHFIQKRCPQYREILRISLPLILSLSATTVMEFTDRIFLANYSIEAISAAMPAGGLSLMLRTLLGGVSSYSAVFIAQYIGRGEYDKTGSIFWQAIYFACAASLIIFFCGQLAEPVFALAGHAPRVQEQEAIYFTVLCNGASFNLAMMTFAAFFSGRGITRPVMVTSIIGVLFNIPLDYAMIYGHWGLPEMGIHGAALATVISWMINAVLLGLLIFTRENDRLFGVFSQRSFHRDRFLRLLRFGIPGALQFTVDVAAFTFFILLIGRISIEALAATNIIISFSSVSFMPALGFGQGLSILTGQAIGRGKPAQAVEYLKRTTELFSCYVLLVIAFFLTFPEPLISLFLPKQESAGEVLAIALILIKILTAYLTLDGLYMVFSGTLRGAGDTRFMMWAVGLCGAFILLLPVYLGITFFEMDIITAWLWKFAFICSLFASSFFRFAKGKWKSMSVIEEE